MTFQEILESLEEIAETSSTLDKQQLLHDFMSDNEFQTVIRLALDPKLSFKLSKLPEPRENLFASAAPLNESETFAVLISFASQSGVSKIEKLELAEGVRKNIGATELVNRIVKKDLRCGVQAALVNKVSPEFIKVWPYMRCKSHSAKNFEAIRYPAIAQLKADGTHIDTVCEDGKIKFVSRIGNKYDFLGELDNDSASLFTVNGELEDGVFIGEGVVLDENGQILDRKTGNGIINKGLYGTLSQEEASRIRIQLWEYVPLDIFHAKRPANVPYEEALESAEYYSTDCQKFSIIEYQMVENYEEVLAYYKDVKARKLEGLIVKNLTGTFKSTNSGSPDQVKVKAILGEEYEAEFKIIGINPGKEGTRFENGIGSFPYESACGKIQGNVGSGMSHKERDTWGTEMIGKIITIRFDDLVSDKRVDGIFALYAPRIIEVREKSEADTLEYVQELMGG